MYRPLSLELLNAVENLDFWASTEVVPGCDRREILATFDELADRARCLARPGEADWLERRICVSRSRIDRRTRPRRLDENSVAAGAKAHRAERASVERRSQV